ncbi:importin-9 [Anopheles aquasalis]|uniref:importin-9 n=1 Tax=Anopheles aquasalis TaxID=42839 RepID=UPI00215A40A4|nr:importin-9 [Anopheles aquasalis]
MAQNSDAVKQAMFEELQIILNPDSEQRKSAEARLAQLKFTEWYGVSLAEFTIDQHIHIGIRQLASVMLKQYVDDCWTGEGDENEEQDGVRPLSAMPSDQSTGMLLVNDEAKMKIKKLLPEGLYDQNSKIRSVVAYCIANIALYDWPGDWQELFDVIVKCLSGTENSIDGAMKVLVEFTLELDKQVADVAPLILSEVYRIFSADTIYSVTARKYAVEILYALLRSINVNLTTRHQKSAILNPVLPNFMQRLIEGLTAPNGAHSSFQLKTQIIKVLKYMISDMSKFVRPYIATILPTIWQLLTQLADFYVKVVVNELESGPFNGTGPEGEDEADDFVQMILQIFEFVHTIIEMKRYKAAITNVLTDLVYITLLYMQITEEQAQEWLEDAEKFVDDEDEQGVEFTIRATAHDVLLIVEQEYGKQLLPCFAEALSKHSAVAEVDRNAGNPHWWKIHESSMLAVGSFKGLIVESGPAGGFNMGQYLALIKMLMESQASPYLLGRCLWLLSRYADCDVLGQPFAEQIVNVTVNSMALDKPIVLRIMAARAVHGFCTNLKGTADERMHVLIMSKIQHFLDGLLPLFEQSQNTVVCLLLEALNALILFDANATATLGPKIIDVTMAVFMKYHDDRFLLEMVQDVLRTLSQNPLCLPALQERIIPTLVDILGNEASDSTHAPDVALDVLQTLVKYAKAPLSEAMIESAFPAAVHCVLRTEDHSVMQSGGECLRSFLAVAPEQIGRFRNGEGLNYVLQVATMLLNPMNTESTASFIGRLVITIITKVGHMLGDSVDLLLKAVISKMQLVESLNVIMSLVTIFAHLMLLQLDAVLNFLSTVPGPTGETAMSFVLANWLSRQHLFYGQYEGKVTTLALCKLFEHGVTTMDERLNSVMIKEQIVVSSTVPPSTTERRVLRSAGAKSATIWVDTPVLVKIFKLLLHELANLRDAANEGELDSEESSSGDEDGGDGGSSTVFRSGEEGKTGRGPSTLDATLNFALGEDEEEDEDDRQLLAELMADPIFQCETIDYLTKFIESFSKHENFRAFLEKIDEKERKILQSFNISLQ